MVLNSKISKKRFIIAGIITGLIGGGIMSLYDLYNEESFSIIKFLIFFFIFGFLNSYLQYKALKNVEESNDQAFKNDQF